LQAFTNTCRKARTGQETHYAVTEHSEDVDRSYEGPIGIFRKLSDLKYQQEMRLAVSGGDNKPLKLSIGDIRDICDVCPSSHFRFGYVDVETDGRATIHVDASTADGSPV